MTYPMCTIQRLDHVLTVGGASTVGMGAVLRSLLGRLDCSPWGLLQAVPPVPMAAPLRQAAVLALQAAVQVHYAPVTL